jgi:nitrate reductase delta subunit
MTTELAVVVAGFGYPGPGSARALADAVQGLSPGPVRSEMECFAEAVSRVELGEWEELHTRSLDLSPLFVPYVGHVVWGESYRRGAFMADLQRAQLDAAVDQGGELPDHLVPILAYLDAVEDPLPDLVEALPRAVAAMRKDLAKTEPENPYRHLLAAAAAAVDARLAQGASA